MSVMRLWQPIGVMILVIAAVVMLTTHPNLWQPVRQTTNQRSSGVLPMRWENWQ